MAWQKNLAQVDQKWNYVKFESIRTLNHSSNPYKVIYDHSYPNLHENLKYNLIYGKRREQSVVEITCLVHRKSYLVTTDPNSHAKFTKGNIM